MVRLVFPVALAFLLLGSVHVVKAGTRGDAVVRVALCSDCHGTLTGYCGRPVKDESPVLIFPNGFQPGEVIFGGNRVRVEPCAK
jgi:hypothetical protein